MSDKSYGISAIGTAIPELCLSVTELAKLRNVDPDKYLVGLGCKEIAICPKSYSVIDLGVKAARRAIENWSGDVNDIAIIAVGTESGIDLSRPLSAWIAEELGLKGQVRSYEVKHACYGATLALRQSLEWQYCNDHNNHGGTNNKVALVIATDIALYAPKHPGEPTQGAGAIAFIVGQPTIAEVNINSYFYSEPCFDFWRPISEPYPLVNGALSLTSYNKAVLNCFKQLHPLDKLVGNLQEYSFLNFHIPFPKMVDKAIKNLGKHCGLSSQDVEELISLKVTPTLDWNKKIGNAYTASLWFAVAKSLTLTQEQQLITAFSYGSGFGAELLLLRCIKNQNGAVWMQQLEHDFANRKYISGKEYDKIRSG